MSFPSEVALKPHIARPSAKTIVVERLLEGGRLGLAVKDLHILGIVDAAANVHGWTVGDRIVSVNGAPVSTQEDFDQALQTALAQHWACQEPLRFETCSDLLQQQDAASGFPTVVPGLPLGDMNSPSRRRGCAC